MDLQRVKIKMVSFVRQCGYSLIEHVRDIMSTYKYLYNADILS